MPVDYNDGEHPNLMQIGVFITITVRPAFFHSEEKIEITNVLAKIFFLLCFLE